ncbi:MAG TPA: hypothetical protein VGZ73_03910 [Bryobacteraceae bacterium]|nr:hypothetical protein [Bryobacteraceae bacterium]
MATPEAGGAAGQSPNAALTDERRALDSKLQPAVLAALDCFHKSANSGSSCAGVHAGKVTLQVWLTEDSPAARAQLQALGCGFTKAGVEPMVGKTFLREVRLVRTTLGNGGPITARNLRFPPRVGPW